MPTYYKPGTRKGNRNIVVRGSVDGPIHEIATPYRDQKRAEDYWHAFKREIRAQRDSAATPERATFLDAVILYRQARPALSRNEHRFISRLETYFGTTLLKDITQSAVQAAAIAIYPDCLPQTRNRQAIAPAAAIMHYAAESELCPYRRFGKFREIDPDRPMTLPEQADTAIAAARTKGDHELAVALEILVYQGWRISEVLNAQRLRIDWQAGTIRRRVSKSGKWRTTAIDWQILELIAALPPRDDGRIFRWQTRFAFYRSIDALELDFHYRPHQSRRGFATALKNDGADAADIAQASQWEDTRSVSVYVADDIERQRRTITRLRRARKTGRNTG